MNCKNCNTKLNEEDYIFMGYCENCFEQYGEMEAEENSKNSTSDYTLLISNSEKKENKQYQKSKKRKIECPFCHSREYQIMNDNSLSYVPWGFLISIILFVIGNFTIRMIAGIISISVILTYVINKANSNTLVVRCKKCNQKYKINRQDLKNE